MAEKDIRRVVTGKVRFSYVHVFEKHAIDGGEAKYSVAILIPKKDKNTLAKIKSAVLAAKEEGKSSKFGGKIPAILKLPLRDGDAEKPDDPVYKGMFWVNANSSQKPSVFDENGNEIIDEEEFYSGCWGKAIVTFYAFAGKSKGIACGLNGIKKTHEGEKLSGSSVSAADFDDEDENDMM